MKKLIYISTISFLLFSLASCYTNKILTSKEQYSNCINKSNDSSEFKKNVTVFLVVTKQGDSVVFTKQNPGRIIKSGVFGNPEVRLPYGTVDSTDFYYTLNTIWENGIPYQFIGQDSTGYICVMKDTVNIPFSEINSIKVRKLNGDATALVIIGAAVIVAIPVAIIINYWNNWNPISGI